MTVFRRMLLLSAACLLAACALGAPPPHPNPSVPQERLVSGWQRQYESWRRHAPAARLEEPHWSPRGQLLAYRNPADSAAWVLVDCRSGKVGPAFDAKVVAAEFSRLTGKQLNPGSLPFRRVLPQDDGSLVLQGDKAEWILTREGKLSEAKGARTAPPVLRLQDGGRMIDLGKTGLRSPKGPQQVVLREGDLYLNEGEGTGERRLVERPSGAPFQFIEPVSWSPDGSHFAVWAELRREPRLYKVTDSLKGVTKEIPYEKPGDERTERVAWVFSADGKIASRCPDSVLPKSFSTDRLDWSADGKTLRTEFVRRGFTGHGIIAFDVVPKAWRIVLEERSPKFVYTFNSRFRHDLSDDRTLWASERTGWRHLYVAGLGNPGNVRPITSGEWVVKQVLHVDQVRSEVYFIAVGRNPGENPYHHHVCKAGLDGTPAVVDLTPGDGNHEVTFSPDRRTLIDVSSRVDRAPTFSLRSALDGSLIAHLHAGDTRALEASGWTQTRPFKAKDRDGKFDIWGVVTRPYPFDSTKKYPVIENIYAGPHGSFAPKSFNWWNRNHRELASLGFYVVQMDGRGTNHRGREFHQQSWRNLKDGGFPDRIAWLKALAETEPSMDLDRVGIFGGSAGGQNTAHALLLHGDFYKAGAADCGCYDNRVDKLWWNEQWLGWPVGPSYDENSCSRYASALRGRLLLTLGESDTNVDVKCTYDFRDALIEAGKDCLVDFHVVPGANHGAGESEEMREKRAWFFKSALGGPLSR